MKSIELSQVEALTPFLQFGNEEPFLLTRNGKTVAAVVPTSGEDAESLLLSVNPQFQTILDRSHARFQTEGGLTDVEVRQRLGLPLADSD